MYIYSVDPRGYSDCTRDGISVGRTTGKACELWKERYSKNVVDLLFLGSLGQSRFSIRRAERERRDKGSKYEMKSPVVTLNASYPIFLLLTREENTRSDVLMHFFFASRSVSDTSFTMAFDTDFPRSRR